MLAARMYGAGDIRLEEMPVPAIGEQELLLKIKAAAICGTDVRMFTNGAAGIDPGAPPCARPRDRRRDRGGRRPE